jgi:hypothetical protein
MCTHTESDSGVSSEWMWHDTTVRRKLVLKQAIIQRSLKSIRKRGNLWHLISVVVSVILLNGIHTRPLICEWAYNTALRTRQRHEEIIYNFKYITLNTSCQHCLVFHALHASLFPLSLTHFFGGFAHNMNCHSTLWSTSIQMINELNSFCVSFSLSLYDIWMFSALFCSFFSATSSSSWLNGFYLSLHEIAAVVTLQKDVEVRMIINVVKMSHFSPFMLYTFVAVMPNHWEKFKIERREGFEWKNFWKVSKYSFFILKGNLK